MLCRIHPLSLNVMSKACLLVLLSVCWFGLVLLPRLFPWMCVFRVLSVPLAVLHQPSPSLHMPPLPNHRLKPPVSHLKRKHFPFRLPLVFSHVNPERPPPCGLSPSLPSGKWTLVVWVISILISVVWLVVIHGFRNPPPPPQSIRRLPACSRCPIMFSLLFAHGNYYLPQVISKQEPKSSASCTLGALDGVMGERIWHWHRGHGGCGLFSQQDSTGADTVLLHRYQTQVQAKQVLALLRLKALLMRPVSRRTNSVNGAQGHKPAGDLLTTRRKASLSDS